MRVTKPFDVIVTLSERLATPSSLRGFVERGATIFRINGAHVTVPTVQRIAHVIRRSVGRQAKVLLDCPGRKIRLANLPAMKRVKAGQPITLAARHFNYPTVLAALRVGQVLLTSDGQLELVVDSLDPGEARLLPRMDGVMENRKGVHVVGGGPALQLFSECDLEVVDVAKACGVDFLGLSFIRSEEDVVEARRLLQGSQVDLICKIETREACERLDEILRLTSHILVDRGDLSSEIGLCAVPTAERRIANQASRAGVRILIATQLLSHMVEHPIPSMAELMALHQVMTYADGVQLSEETVIGKYPFEVLETIRTIRERAVQETPVGPRRSRGAVIWLLGLPGSGKTTLARALQSRLESAGERVVSIDGDEARAFTSGALGYAKEHREAHLRYLTFASKKAAEAGSVVLVAAVSPYEQLRQWVRQRLGDAYFEVYVTCPLEVCMQRDPKGHYAKALQGSLSDFVGVDMEFETPQHAQCVIDTSRAGVEACVDELLRALSTSERAQARRPEFQAVAA